MRVWASPSRITAGSCHGLAMSGRPRQMCSPPVNCPQTAQRRRCPALSGAVRFVEVPVLVRGAGTHPFGCPVGLGPLPVRGIDGTGAHQEGAVHVGANVAVGQNQAGVQLQLKTSGLGVVADSGHRRGVFRGGRHLYCCVFGDDPRWCSKLDGCRCVARRGRRPLAGGARRRWGLGDDGWRARRSARRRRVRGGAGVRSTSIAVASGDRPG